MTSLPVDVLRLLAAGRPTIGPMQLSAVLASATRALGFAYYISVQRCVSRRADKGLQLLTNVPAQLDVIVRACCGAVHAPAFLAGGRTSAGFLWSDMDRIIVLSDRQRELLSRARETGIANGYSVPAHLPGEASGLTTFLVAAGQPIPEAGLPIAQWVGAFAFDALRPLERSRHSFARVRLTNRQVECILHVAQGKTDVEIATALGIAEDTVTEYLDAARRRYGVSKRNQLIVRALYDGWISLAEALWPCPGP